MRWEQVPDLPLFATNTAAFIHDMDEAATRGSIKAASLLSRLAPEAVLGFLADPSVRKIPRRLYHISAALERGELTVRMRSFADPRDVKLIVQLTNRALLGLFSASIGLVAVLLLRLHGGPKLFDAHIDELRIRRPDRRHHPRPTRARRHHPRRPLTHERHANDDPCATQPRYPARRASRTNLTADGVRRGCSSQCPKG
jgi:hypothetical protein